MTQEEKAKAYDEAIERAKNFIENGDESERTIAESIFAGLMEESDDERIRQFLIHEVTETSDKIMSYRNMSKKDVLAWLEKQGKQKPTEWHREDEQNLNACLGYIRDEFLRRWLTDIIHVKYDKPTDKVIQKFKLGDWVVTSYGKVNQVVSVDKDGDGYTLDDGVYFSGSWCDMYHLWTIQDAKDGDVLVDEDRAILLFRGVGNNEWSDAIDYYALLETNMNNRFRLQEGDAYWGKVDNCSLCPATKEQRDTLEKAMTDAGYTFDFEKKELKKIDTYCQENCKGFQETGRCFCDGECKAKKEHIKQNLQDNNSRRIEQKSVWSEEDDNCLSTIIAEFSKCSGKSVSKDEWMRCNDFLNSLRDRYVWKPSDEQMKILNEVLNFAANHESPYWNDYIFGTLSYLIRQLKKLREKEL